MEQQKSKESTGMEPENIKLLLVPPEIYNVREISNGFEVELKANMSLNFKVDGANFGRWALLHITHSKACQAPGQFLLKDVIVHNELEKYCMKVSFYHDGVGAVEMLLGGHEFKCESYTSYKDECILKVIW